MSLPLEPTDEQRNELVEEVAREIQLRGLTGPAVEFLFGWKTESTRPPVFPARVQSFAQMTRGEIR